MSPRKCCALIASHSKEQAAHVAALAVGGETWVTAQTGYNSELFNTYFSKKIYINYSSFKQRRGIKGEQTRVYYL